MRGRYKRRLPPSPELLFLTNDADNRKKAAAEGLTAMTTVVSPAQSVYTGIPLKDRDNPQKIIQGSDPAWLVLLDHVG